MKLTRMKMEEKERREGGGVFNAGHEVQDGGSKIAWYHAVSRECRSGIELIGSEAEDSEVSRQSEDAL